MHVAKKSVVFLMKQVERQYHFLFSKYNFVIAAEREENAKRVLAKSNLASKRFVFVSFFFNLRRLVCGAPCTNSPPSHLHL